MNKIIALIFTLSAASVAACSSDTTTSTPPVDAGKDTATTDTGTAKDTATGTDTKPATDTGGGGDSACGEKSTNSECQKCCNTNHTAAYTAFVKTLTDCGCKAGNCDTACATTACASPPVSPDATCNKCLNDIQGTACKADLSACAAAACADFFTCVADQGCNDKP